MAVPHTFTASPEFREVERLREKARHDEAQALYHAKIEEKIEIARNLLKIGVCRITRLPLQPG